MNFTRSFVRLTTAIALSATTALSSYAGEAIVPFVYATAAPIGNNALGTDLHIVNLSANSKNITLALMNQNGMPMSSTQLVVYPGGSSSYTATTDANGAISTEVPALNMLAFSLSGPSSVKIGYGKIRCEPLVTDMSTGPCVASGVIRDYNGSATPDTASWTRTITINGGNPF